MRITDGAIVAAATRSNRYITDRFLPDKAIDLVDEAALKLRMEVDSKPEEIDELDRRIIQLKIEREALKKETDQAFKDRLERLELELADLEQKSAELTSGWQLEKTKISDAHKVNERLDHARSELEQAQRGGDLARAGEIAYGVIPELERTLAEAADTDSNRMLSEEVTDGDIAGVVSRWTGVPVDKMMEGERDRLLGMEAAIGARVIGQEEAVATVSDAVRRARAGLRDPNRPLGSFVYLGPTGVGKTELTKALAAFLFDDVSALLRIDMSEYMEKHSVARLIGAPPGYVGYDEGGALTEAVRRRPYQVILFDEIEKAHGDVFNVLTSNLGSEILAAQPADRDSSSVRDEVMEVVRAAFRPEFHNRLDEILLFHRLSREHMTAIVDIQLDRLAAMLADRKIGLEVDAGARQWLGDQGYDPVYGARPLKRVIQRRLQNPMASLILESRIQSGETVRVSTGDDGLVINGVETSAIAAE